LDVQTGDFWGLFEGRTFRFEPQRLVVYPRIVPLTHLGLHSQVPVGDLQSHRRLTEDPSRIFGVRPYLVGDSLRKVNWKTTAKTGSLQVKRFQSSITLDAHLFLNLKQSDYSLRGMFTAIETGITVVASLAVHLSERRQTVGLTVFGLDPLIESMAAHTIPLRKGRAHLMQLLELLARIQKASSSTAFIQILQQSSAGLPWGTLSFVVTPSIEDDMFDVLLGLRRRGLQPVLILNQPGRNFRVVQAQAKQICVPCFRIERVKDMDVWRQEKHGP